ncbi:DUF397 domain-containing protein [Streptomyces atratus]|uniref:DUF397 domain-containing protein n=1 Tax=Streptomyces atratus TaxID=1893 RepID=A0A1K1WF36_STRAR|nr:DUF397 domain-containing protein [Streptomyces atratus]SFX36008.1 protein of unknown function [Streptomyces atratus]
MQYDPTELAWRTSSYSSGNGQCVEVADVQGAVPVRDSKAASGPVLIFGAGAWAAFVAGMRERGIAAAV